MLVETASPIWRASSTVIGKSWVQRPSVSAVASAAALSRGRCFASTSATNTATWSRAFAAMSTRISISSLIAAGFFSSRSLTIEPAGRSPICGSTGPRTALGSMTISSAASPENSRTMKEKSHRAARRCYESGVETLQGTQTRRLDGYSLYSAQRSPGPRDFEADHRPVRPAASQFRRRRRSAESGRRSARADVATGQRDPRPSPSRQGGAPAPGSAAAARLRAGLWLRRLQRRRAAGRRPDPQTAARSRSARGRGLGVATDAVAVRERRGPGRPLSARDRAGRRRADLPPRAPRRGRAAHHDRSRCDRRPDPWAAGVRPLQRLLRHVVLSAPHCHGDVQHRAAPTRRGGAAAAGDRSGDPRRPRALAPAVHQAPRALSARAAARPGRCGLRRRHAAGLPRRRRGGVRVGAGRQPAAGQAGAAAARSGTDAGPDHRGDGNAVWRDAVCRPALGPQAAHYHEGRGALLSRPLAQGQPAVSGDKPAASAGHGLHPPVLRPWRHGEPAERTAAGAGHGPDQLLAIRRQPTPPAVLRRGLRPVPGAAELGAGHRRRVRSGLDAARAAGEDCRLGRALGATHRTAHAASLPVARYLARPRPGADRDLIQGSMTTVLAQGRRISPTRTTNSRAQSSRPVAGVALTVTPPRAIVSAPELSTRRSLEPSRPLVGAFTNSPG